MTASGRVVNQTMSVKVRGDTHSFWGYAYFWGTPRNNIMVRKANVTRSITWQY